ncbi:MAG TPA: DedA family protein [Bacteroidales bacterium]|nr:DedA family protein [Bacteroidales bacterium]HQB56404.1 DedA family protein [Bacteroidales bacterium]
MESISFIQWALEHLNYWTVALLMTIESSFIPFPSEIVVPPAAYLAAAGEMNVYLMVLSATAGALLGALINYGLALWIGRAIVYKFVNSRLGHALLLSEQTLIKAENYFVRYGNVSTLIGRLVPAVRQLISIPAGLAKMPIGPFVLYTSIGAGLWNIILAVLGYSLHSVVPKDQLMEKVHEYSSQISWVLLGVGVLVFGYIIWKVIRKK